METSPQLPKSKYMIISYIHIQKEKSLMMYVSLKGIRIVDKKTQKVQHEHPVEKITFVTVDPEDKTIFGYVCSEPCTTGHKLYAIKSKKPAEAVTGTLRLHVLQLSQEVHNSSQVQNSPQVSNGETRMPSPAEPRPVEVRDIIFPFKGETVWRLEVQHMLEVS